MIALEVFVQGKFMILISESLILVYFEFRLSSTSAMFLRLVLVEQKVELESTLCNMLPQLARQVGHKRGNTRNREFQLAMQQCYVARQVEEKCCSYYRTLTRPT